MTDREKILELIDEAKNKDFTICNDHPVCKDCPAKKDDVYCHEGIIVDHLIANGVTLQRWIPVTERLPGCEDVLVVVKSKYDFESQYTIDVDVAAHRFDGGYIDNRWDTFNDWDEGQQYLHVTHWMPLPEPPKGENE